MVYVLKYSERPMSKENIAKDLGCVELYSDLASAVKRVLVIQNRYFAMFPSVNTEERNGRIEYVFSGSIYPNAVMMAQIEAHEVMNKTIE